MKLKFCVIFERDPNLATQVKDTTYIYREIKFMLKVFLNEILVDFYI